jgi:hypothetical protein
MRYDCELAKNGTARGDGKTALNVPRAALEFCGGRCEFQAADPGQNGKIPVKLVARSAQPINHWYWGNIVHDMSGMQTSGPAIPLDYCHDSDEVIGYGNKFDTTGDLVVSGALTPFADGDRANEIAYKADAGVPYQASIFFDPDDLVLEDVPKGRSVAVNGFRFEGPGVVVRQWMLRGVALCPYGADRNTSATFAADDEVQITILRKETVMSVEPTKKDEVAAPSHSAAAAVESSATELPVGAASQAPDPVKLRRDEGKRFLDAFGDRGGRWFAEGLSFEEAQTRFVDALKDENAELKKRTAGAQLAGATSNAAGGVSFGEEKPLSFDAANPDPDADNKLTSAQQRYGRGLGAFINSTQMPAAAVAAAKN